MCIMIKPSKDSAAIARCYGQVDSLNVLLRIGRNIS